MQSTLWHIAIILSYINLFLTACGADNTGGSVAKQANSTSATLSWESPTTNADGTPLKDLAGYKLYFGMTSGQYKDVVDIQDPNITEHTIENLAKGTYYFAVTAIDTNGNESEFSNEVSKSIQ